MLACLYFVLAWLYSHHGCHYFMPKCINLFVSSEVPYRYLLFNILICRVVQAYHMKTMYCLFAETASKLQGLPIEEQEKKSETNGPNEVEWLNARRKDETNQSGEI